MNFSELFEKVEQRLNLTREEGKQAVFAMMEETWTSEQTGDFLKALHSKGETSDEMIGFAQAMRDKALTVELNGKRVLDTCGTGGDRKNSFNISTITAFVLAGCGIPVVKHGNRAASSVCGSADLLNALGISYRLSPQHVLPLLEETNFAFLFAPDYHPATRAVVAVRRQLGVPTIFNLLGPLTNPARPAAQIIGLYDRNAMPIMEEALRKMDPEKRAFLVHSNDGHDEATPIGDFLLHSTFESPSIQSAKKYGFNECCNEDLIGGTPETNAEISLNVLNGEPGPKQDTVLLNAMLGYIAYHQTASITDAKMAVKESIDSGAALRVVQKYREMMPA
jgi:anthranilate phosphoribosyltransferase